MNNNKKSLESPKQQFNSKQNLAKPGLFILQMLVVLWVFALDSA